MRRFFAYALYIDITLSLLWQNIFGVYCSIIQG